MIVSGLVNVNKAERWNSLNFLSSFYQTSKASKIRGPVTALRQSVLAPPIPSGEPLPLRKDAEPLRRATPFSPGESIANHECPGFLKPT